MESADLAQKTSTRRTNHLNILPFNKILRLFQIEKTFCNKLNGSEIIVTFFNGVEKIIGKGENAGY